MLIKCSGSWVDSGNGVPSCQGTLQVVSEAELFSEQFGLTYEEASFLLAQVALVFAIAFSFRMIRRFLF